MCAAAWRSRGDAAHLNSPSGGMGLNGGLHDAFALAEALTAIRRGAGPERLALYDRVRRPVAAEQILAQAGRNRARMRTRDPARRREILAELQAVARDPARLKAHLMRTSMIEGAAAGGARGVSGAGEAPEGLRSQARRCSGGVSRRQDEARVTVALEYAPRGLVGRADATGQHHRRAGDGHPHPRRATPSSTPGW